MEKTENGNREKADRIYNIGLKDMTFMAYHGCREDEKVCGNTFRVDLEYSFASGCAADDDLQQTVNYGRAYGIVKEVMLGTRCNLIETLAVRIADAVEAEFPQILSGKVTVAKKNPPVDGPCAWSEVTTSFGGSGKAAGEEEQK